MYDEAESRPTTAALAVVVEVVDHSRLAEKVEAEERVGTDQGRRQRHAPEMSAKLSCRSSATWRSKLTARAWRQRYSCSATCIAWVLLSCCLPWSGCLRASLLVLLRLPAFCFALLACLALLSCSCVLFALCLLCLLRMLRLLCLLCLLCMLGVLCLLCLLFLLGLLRLLCFPCFLCFLCFFCLPCLLRCSFVLLSCPACFARSLYSRLACLACLPLFACLTACPACCLACTYLLPCYASLLGQ